MLKSTDWFKEGSFKNNWFRCRLQFCVFSGLAIEWWSKFRAAPRIQLKFEYSLWGSASANEMSEQIQANCSDELKYWEYAIVMQHVI